MKRFVLILLTILFNLISVHCFTQDQHLVDSLQLKLKKYYENKLRFRLNTYSLYDTTAVSILTGLSIAYRPNNYDKATDYVNQSLVISEKIGYKEGIGSAYNNLGVINIYKADYPAAMEFLKKALAIRRKTNDLNAITATLNNIGAVFYSEGNYAEALKYYLESLRISEKIGNKKVQTDNYMNIGGVYEEMRNNSEALKYFSKCRQICEEMGDKEGVVFSVIKIIDVNNRSGNLKEALKLLLKELELNKKLGNDRINAAIYYYLGTINKKLGNYKEAINYLNISLTISKKIGENADIADSYILIGTVYSKLKNYKSASYFLNKALSLAKRIGSLEKIKDSYENLASVDSLQGNFKSSLEYYKKFIATRDSMFSKANTRKTIQTQMQYDFDKKESLNKAEQEKKDAIAKKEIQRQKLVRNGFIGGFSIVLLFAGVFFRQRNRIKKGNEALQLAKERAEQSERYEQQFLANMSHEIRTPMNAVMGMTNLLINKSPREDQLNYLDGIKKSSENLLYIINDILDLSKIEAGKIEFEQIDFSLHSVIHQVKQTLNHKAEEKGLYLITEIAADVPDVVIGDPVRLNQILINLTGNAIKYTEKGSVTIEVRVVNSEQVTVNNTSLKFSIVDTGIGIPKDKLQTVFESFKQAHSSDTRKYGGTGLGLSISKQFVELMGGNISIESEEGSGTTFSFVLNLPIGSAEKINTQKSTELIDGSTLNGLKILLADDNEYNLTVARDSIMAIAEVIIKEAMNGKEVIELLNKEDFDVVLMDVQMPVMDGYETTRYIREHFDLPKNKVPVIALTASVIKSDLDKCRQAGMNDYVPKPFIVSQLVTAIAKATNREIKFTEKKSGNEHTGDAINTRITDLSYLRKFCEEDETRMKKYIDIFISTAPIVIEKIQLALANNELIEIANQLHGFKTKMIMMGMNESKDLAMEIEMECRKENLAHNSLENIKILIKQINSSLIELKKFS